MTRLPFVGNGNAFTAFLLALMVPGWAPETGAAAAANRIDFNRDIRPILSENCYACHGPDKEKRKAGLRLDLQEEAFKKLDSGDFAIVPGKADRSQLLKLVALPPEDDDHMPPSKSGKQLTRAQIELLRRWIEQGAVWSGHWSYMPPQRPVPPQVRSKKWARNDIDRFILARLEKEGLPPDKEASRPALVRRLSLDLTGLPPTIREVDEFVGDKNPDAYEKLVERLLSSPHFGERMALAWLDQARYADTAGYHFDGFRQMHLWRDWVINAFNQNKPFDQFTIEQLAGDLLPDATIEQKIATGFNRNVMTNDEGGADPEEYLIKYAVERASTTAQVWLGTTLGCAECHDHKYDPISTREFYQFYAFFNNVPEKGLDRTRVRNPVPVLKVPTSDQGARLLRYLDLIPAAEKTVADREAELPKAQEKWEKALAGVPPINPSAIKGLLLEIPFDETLATQDGRGHERHALTTASTNLIWAEGKIGKALKFRGRTNEVVAGGQAVDFDNTNAFSYGAWIKLQGKSGAVLSKMAEGPSFTGFDLLINDAKVEAHLVNKFPTNAIKVMTKDPLPTNVWQHIWITYDGSNKAAGVRIYVDGKARPLDLTTDQLSGSITNDVPLLIGGRLKAFPFKGLIDDVRFYNRALAAEEVAELAAYGNLLMAQIASDQRTDEQKAALKTFFRENRAIEFLAARERLDTLQKQKKDLLEQIPDTMVMEEMETRRESFVLVRGNFQKKGEKVSASVPACWPALPKNQPASRLTLARWLVSTNHPLTARVTVNRFWAMIFGTGLVKTVNDFGSQGDRPSHPELLDWLAAEFVSPAAGDEAQRMNATSGPAAPGGRRAQPWDIKNMLRLIVTSATYRQSSSVSQEKLERDPYNRLLTRGPRVRLEAELIRDNALAVSGLLNPKIGGPSIKPYQPPGIWEVTDHKYEQSHGADLYRRGLYVFWKRAAHYPSFATFDAPSREICALQRPRTSTPLQSLVLMNDPVYLEAARALAARVLHEGGKELNHQLAYAFRLALARPPDQQEVEVLARTYRQEKNVFTRDEKATEDFLNAGESPRPKDLDAAELAAMTGVANVLLNLNEAITK